MSNMVPDLLFLLLHVVKTRQLRNVVRNSNVLLCTSLKRQPREFAERGPGRIQCAQRAGTARAVWINSTSTFLRCIEDHPSELKLLMVLERHLQGDPWRQPVPVCLLQAADAICWRHQIVSMSQPGLEPDDGQIQWDATSPQHSCRMPLGMMCVPHCSGDGQFRKGWLVIIFLGWAYAMVSKTPT